MTTMELPPNHLACSGCGRATPGPSAETVITQWMPAREVPVAAARLASCPSCTALGVHARLMLPADAAEAAQRRLARALACLRLLGRPLPDPARHTAGEIERWFGGWDVTWSTALTGHSVRPGDCAAEPWSHVGPELRRVLADQFRYWTHVRAFPDRPVPVPGPCLLCGLAAVHVPAEHAHRIARDALWRPVSVSRTSLGGTGAGRIDGALCGPCVDAVSDGGQLVLGPTTMETALARHWETVGETDAARWIRNGDLGGVVAWITTGRPAGEPWEHMEVPALDGAR